MPGANPRALEKAKTLAADTLILDLEDAVAPDAKAEARDTVCGAVKAGGYGKREVVIRINGLDTEWGMDDLKAAVAGETHEYTDMYPGMAKSARDEGFDEIADWFETLAKAEKSHAGRFQKAIDTME